MSEVVYTDSGPMVEVEIEETTIPGTSATSTPSLGGDVNVKRESVAEG